MKIKMADATLLLFIGLIILIVIALVFSGNKPNTVNRYQISSREEVGITRIQKELNLEEFTDPIMDDDMNMNMNKEMNKNTTLIFNMVTVSGFKMGCRFALAELILGFPVIVILNVDVAKNAVNGDTSQKLEENMYQKELVRELVKTGAKVYVCPSCLMQFYNSDMKDIKLIDGVEFFSVEKINKYLLQMNTKVISY